MKTKEFDLKRFDELLFKLELDIWRSLPRDYRYGVKEQVKKAHSLARLCLY